MAVPQQPFAPADRQSDPTARPLPALTMEFAKTAASAKTTAFAKTRLPPENSGRGAAWIARLLGVQEVGSSNLPAPTERKVR